MRTPQLEKSTLSHRTLYTNRYTDDQRVPHQGQYCGQSKKNTLAVLESILRSVKRQRVHNSIGVKNIFFLKIWPKGSCLYKGELIFLHIFLKITLWFCIIMQINNKSLMQVGIILPSCR